MEGLLRDLHFGARMLRKSPGFTVTAIVMLALGIGANTAIFSVVDAILVRPLPFPDPGRLALVTTFIRGRGGEELDDSVDGRTWEAVRDHAGFLRSAPFTSLMNGVNFLVHGQPQYVMQQRVGAGFFGVLGVAPLAGREFTSAEDRPGGPPVAVLSYELWMRSFHGDRTIIGSAVTLRGEPYTVLGIMPQGFRTSVPADLWTPLRPSTTGEGQGTNYGIVARLRPGVSWAQASEQMRVVGEPVLKARGIPKEASARMQVTPLQRGLTESIRQPLLILWAAVGLVLLIACVNVAGLLLARSASRAREIATRMALGSGRARIVRQLLAESLLLACGGGALGVAVGRVALDGLKLLGGETFGALRSASLDGRVLASAAVAALATSILFGLAPALQASRADLRSGLTKSGGRGVAGGANRWPRRVLVGAQVALGMVLLTGAGLLIRSFAHLRGLDAGFDPANLITGKLSLQDARYRTPEKVGRLFEESLRRIRELPGVESAAVSLGLPYERMLNVGFRRMDGERPQDRWSITNLCYVTPGYFHALGVPLLRGRVLQASDRAASAGVVVVNRAFVKRYFPDADPLASRIWLAGTPREIVGIVGDTQQRSGWGSGGPLAPAPLAFIPVSQTTAGFLQMAHTWFSPNWIVRASVPVHGVIAGMERAVHAVDPELPFAGFRSLEQVRAESLGLQRFLMVLLAAMAGLAMVLAAVGMYGLIAASVAERTRELGIRMALGATARQAAAAVAAPGLALALTGISAGAVLARAVAGVLRHLVWGVSTSDPATFAFVAAALLAAAAMAVLFPALRVLRLDPARILRDE